MANEFPYVEIPAKLEKVLGVRREGTRVYVQTGGAELFGKWHGEICRYIGPTVSPGGACALAHVTRAGVHKRMKDGKLTAFWFYSNEKQNEPPLPFVLRLFQPRHTAFVYIPVSECRAWGELVAAKYKRLEALHNAGKATPSDQEEMAAYDEEVGDPNETADESFAEDTFKKLKKGAR